jgi:putative ABC transport system ATP-binding protein
MSETIKIANLNYYFGRSHLRKQVLFDISLTVQPGEIIILTGPSGSGKTTLISLIGALRSTDEGSLQILGQELVGRNETQLMFIRQQIGFIFQHHNLFASLTALQNVCMALELHDLPMQKVKSLSLEILEKIGLGHRINYKPEALSGGQKQRVAIARALVGKPQIILADEPTASLDKKSTDNVISLMRDIVKNEHKSLLMVTHDSRIFGVADRIIKMTDGCISSD